MAENWVHGRLRNVYWKQATRSVVSSPATTCTAGGCNTASHNATSILLLCDGGGSNSANHFIFKEDLQKLVERIGVEIRIAHYPPYTSKYNPIEHRLFPPVTRACQGVVFDSLQTVEKWMAKTQTHKGLKVVDKLYLTGCKYAESFKANIPIIFDCHLPKWNYTAVPSIAIA